MNYSKIYTQLIERAKIRDLTCYTERHHIIPKCLGGLNNEENIVELSAREHYIAHLLLLHIHPNNDKIKYSFWMMSHRNNGDYSSSKIYAEIKEFISRVFRKNVGTPEAILKMSNSKKGQQPWIGKKHSKLSKLRQSESAKKRIIPEATEKIRREKIGKAHLGRKLSKEWCENISKTKVGDKNHMFGKTGVKHHNSKKVIQLSLEGNFIKEWDNARIASDVLNISYGGISACCREKSKTSGKFKWKYK